MAGRSSPPASLAFAALCAWVLCAWVPSAGATRLSASPDSFVLEAARGAAATWALEGWSQTLADARATWTAPPGAAPVSLHTQVTGGGGKGNLRVGKGKVAAGQPQCRRCTCDLGFGNCEAEGSGHGEETQSLTSEECLALAPCCDCQAGRQGWPLELYRRSSDESWSTEGACARCSTERPYDLDDMESRHPKTPALELWEAAAAGNQALSWAGRLCHSGAANATRSGLKEYVSARAACGAAALGEERTRMCACRDGDVEACAPRATADPSLVLLRRAARPLGKDSFACNSSDFSAHGGLFEPELDRMLQGAAPQLVAAWAASRLEGLALGGAAPSLRYAETWLLGATLSGSKRASLDALAEDWHDEVGLDRQRLARQAQSDCDPWQPKVQENSSHVPCAAARKGCFEDAQCWATMQTALAPQGSFLDVLADAVQSFAGNATVRRALAMATACPGVRADAVAPLAQAFEELPVADAGEPVKAAEVAGSLAKALVPVALASRPGLGPPAACVQAREACAADVACAPAAAAMEANSSRATDEILGLCRHREAMTKAVELATSCLGALPWATAHAVKEVLHSSESSQSCTSVKGLLQPASNNASALPTACGAALESCAADASCKTTVEEMGKASSSTKSMLSRLLNTCPQKASMLLALGVTSECPGLLPNAEMKQVLTASGPVPQNQICGKIGQLFEVMGTMLAPPPTVDCHVAQAACDKSKPCRAAQPKIFKSGGLANVTLGESLALCKDKDATLLSLRTSLECKEELPLLGAQLEMPGGMLTDGPTLLRSAYELLQAVDQAQLCPQAKAVSDMFVAQLSAARATEGYGKAAPAISCLHAKANCSSSRCRSVATGQTKMSSGELGQAVLALCDDEASMLASLDLLTECPESRHIEQARQLRTQLAPLPGLNSSGACFLALRLATREPGAVALSSAPPGLPAAAAAPPKAALPPPPTAAELRQMAQRLTAVEVPKLADQLAARLVSVLDVAPTDGRLNAIEMGALAASPALARLDAGGGLTALAAKGGDVTAEKIAKALAPQLSELLQPDVVNGALQ